MVLIADPNPQSYSETRLTEDPLSIFNNVSKFSLGSYILPNKDRKKESREGTSYLLARAATTK